MNNQRWTELPALTGIRALAAIWVLLFHVWALSGQPPLNLTMGPIAINFSGVFAVGWAGVDVFFTLSAFLLTLPFAAWQLGLSEKPNLRHYFSRRVLRIFPAYYFQLAVLLGLALMFGIGRSLDTRELLSHLVLWLLVGSNPVMPLNGVWFTLPIEFCFYLALPILAYLLRPRWAIALLIGTVLFSWAYRYTAYQWVSDLPIPARVNVLEQLPGRIDQFVIGMLAAYAFVSTTLKQRIPSTQRLHGILAIGFGGLVVMCGWIIAQATEYWDGAPLLYVWHTITTVFLALILFTSAARTPLTQRVLANRVLHYLGEISFGIYLWHFPILQWLQPVLDKITPPYLRFLIALALVIPLTIIAAHLSYRLIERPLLRIGRRKPAYPGLASELPPAIVNPGAAAEHSHA